MKLILILLSVLALPAIAQDANCVIDIRGNSVCGTRPGQCNLDRYNNAWCAPANGTATKDRYGEVVCGVGACVTDARSGDIFCATKEGGTTLTDPSGKAACEGGCAPASKSACQRMTPS
ncbi:MAG: hypothetical protein QOD26_1034 [Betaproteobacteria bacterium]|jgi:hypothetical protein|nr:hypothetical protein [Betaproteobacteria bacterium]